MKEVRHFNSLPGWFDFQDVYRDAVLGAPFTRPSYFVEIGTCFGRSAAFMANEIKNSGKPIHFVSLDLFDPLRAEDGIRKVLNDQLVEHGKSEWMEMVLDFMAECGLLNFVTIHKGSSKDFAIGIQDGSLDFVFIDGSHEFKDVMDDIDSYLPKIRKHGVMGGHDFDISDVKRAALKHFHEKSIFVHGQRTWTVNV